MRLKLFLNNKNNNSKLIVIENFFYYNFENLKLILSLFLLYDIIIKYLNTLYLFFFFFFFF